ncbi:hypothetical protein A2631_02040 [Candidatus Daviesbacteria bacterium RIFCSPHIGHO2_01_FULL_44_29]|uniref:VTT domain-containing protein n=1 Tax=Candidatus Daviesbacteria bacterium RIFCSPHIGHO2_02_FULL_43_12 TaxID=1797776 RepID=A0A1F5KJR3_9BACT|nr:MAG: hypothetical protein A2631_02040 [Candidatus Daviesbacteria bacterium RIFCSPHIGHO2_01_FULL_44_29]OGE39547.1 MAG: hypothetical protein A3E86_01860 [Candidatus Daviesbacteria bacterium RIFCSPHIGHO2_12_FULL_47_45]OGE41177.1 MAG: hypothetical protein A3D25_01435 [Candidatus Daviesbacteria bacterium RIFCSPHIGHO2_02_FULL_43_12]OGE69376.1 MAG: hypothetical protein A3B55_03175 [Candidatus Daviesbacteria bacterium RIFCSPLOWO2_01_FULL_43_15]
MSFDLQSLLTGDLKSIIEAVGYMGVFLMVFAESGMLLGFFLPGDSLLFTAGFLASTGIFDITFLTIGCFVAAVAGDTGGYYIGRKFGKRLYARENSKLFKKEHLVQAQKFYEKHGGKTIILARFVPVIRAFAPVVAGMADMKYSTFISYNIIGGLLWAIGLTLTGYFLGSLIPNVDKYLLPIIGAIVLVSIVPGLIHIIKEKKKTS